MAVRQSTEALRLSVRAARLELAVARMRVAGWVRLRLGRCRYGTFGCNGRPVTWWTLDGARFGFCARHGAEFRASIAGENGAFLGEWDPPA